MKKPVSPTFDPAVIAVLHRSGRSWRVLIRHAGPPSVIATREFPLEQADRIEAFLDEQLAGTVLCVLPAAQVICRSVPLPDAPVEQLEPALRLQAEAHLLGIAPPHRLAMSVLPASTGETTRSGLILAWPPSTSPQTEFRAPISSRHVRYVPDVAALAALLNGVRPGEPALWLDRGDGSVAIAVAHSAGVIFRATREEASQVDMWEKSIGRIVAETALNVGHTAAFVEEAVSEARAKASRVAAGDARLFLPDAVRESAASRLHEAPDEEAWWNDYGITAGALLAETGPLASLTRMMHTPPVERPSPVRNTIEALSRPRTAVTVVAICILILMFGPLVFDVLRLGVLKVRYGDVQQELVAARAARAQLAVYKELQREQVWPMTKLLSDVATNAPLGIELDLIKVDAGKDFSVSGTVISRDGKTPGELVAQMAANLRAENLFEDISQSIGDPNNLGVYKFDITGKVAKPYVSANYPVERDFGLWSQADRRDGKPKPDGKTRGSKPADSTAVVSTNTNGVKPEGESATQPPRGGSPEPEPALPEATPTDETIVDADSGHDEDASSPRPRRTGTGPGEDPTNVSGDSSAIGAQIPPPLSEEEIKKMSEPELRQALQRVSKARQHVGGDKEVADRLRKEFNLILAELRKFQGGS